MAITGPLWKYLGGPQQKQVLMLVVIGHFFKESIVIMIGDKNHVIGVCALILILPYLVLISVKANVNEERESVFTSDPDW